MPYPEGDDETRLIPIVIMTALDGLEERIQGIEAGADDFLTKPVHARELLARIQTALRLKHTVRNRLRRASTIIARASSSWPCWRPSRRPSRVLAFSIPLSIPRLVRLTWYVPPVICSWRRVPWHKYSAEGRPSTSQGQQQPGDGSRWSFYHNVTISLRDFYRTFMTFHPPSDILSSIEAGDSQVTLQRGHTLSLTAGDAWRLQHTVRHQGGIR